MCPPVKYAAYFMPIVRTTTLSAVFCFVVHAILYISEIISNEPSRRLDLSQLSLIKAYTVPSNSFLFTNPNSTENRNFPVSNYLLLQTDIIHPLSPVPTP